MPAPSGARSSMPICWGSVRSWWMGATDQPGCQFQALLAVVYWHLLQLATQGTVQRCAEVSCQAFFVPTRRTQRFCPPEAPARASRCAVRAGHRRRGGRPPGAG